MPLSSAEVTGRSSAEVSWASVLVLFTGFLRGGCEFTVGLQHGQGPHLKPETTLVGYFSRQDPE